MKRVLKGLLVAGVAALTLSAQAGVVKVWGDRYSLGTINNFYNSLPGHSSSIQTGELTSASLAGVNLLWAVQPADAYTSSELSAMAAFLAGGGRIAFMGEHGDFAPNENLRINAALAALGASIEIVNSILDAGYRTASVADGQILPHALTTGVNTYEYAAFAPLIVTGTAEKLMLGEALNSVMMAYQNIGAGSVFLITDQNVWDSSSNNWNNGAYDNGRMFENLLVGNTGAPPPNNNVPVPGTMMLLALALMAGGAVSRRRIQ